jgi:hypothetical protein
VTPWTATSPRELEELATGHDLEAAAWDAAAARSRGASAEAGAVACENMAHKHRALAAAARELAAVTPDPPTT